MEWTMPINEMLRDDITTLNHTLIPPGYRGDVSSVRACQESLSRVVDALGEQSSNVQGLNKIITTADKLRTATDHTLYLLKDANANSGAGEAIGFLKVGRKHLFLFDEVGAVREMEPLCVLDFYVRADRQRHGHGRRLFDHMLQDTGLRAHQLAVDGPSLKMEQFLMKNYGIAQLLRQNNNFAVAPQFFAASGDRGDRSPPRSPAQPAPSAPSAPSAPPAKGRFAAHKPHSIIATVIHGGGGERETGVRGAAGASGADLANGEAAGAESGAESRAEGAEAPRRSPERPSTLPVAAVAAVASAASAASAASPRRDSQLTDQGFFDVKFYHNKLW